MSSSSPTQNEPSLLPTELRTNGLEAIANSSLADRYHAHPATTPLEIVGFWSAIVIPLLYLPVIASGMGVEIILGLVAFNLLALLAGHTHRRD